jgi:hypothetical protein
MLLLEDKITKMVDHIHTSDRFGGDPENDDYSMALDSIYWAMRDIDKRIKVAHGVSKAVIIAPDCGKVIKIPFNGYYEIYDEDDDDTVHEEWIPFEYADYRNDNDSDYCRAELDRYELARDKGFEMFFAETSFYGFAPDCTPIYLQEKVIPFEEDYYLSSRKSSKKAQEIVKNKEWEDIINKTWTELAVDYYGEEKVGKFLDFLQQNDMLGDLHNGNIGFGLLDNRPLLLDFSDWND